MKFALKPTALFVVAGLFVLASSAQAQFTAKWLDIGEYHHSYDESGARCESCSTPGGLEWPAIMRESSHQRSQGFWIGVKDWTDSEGRAYPYFVSRIGPRIPGIGFTYPVSNTLVAKYADTDIEVDGAASFDNVAVVDEIDPTLPADRMVHTIHNMSVGVTVDKKAYAWVNQFHDNYHIIEMNYTNTGNVDSDDELELDGQTLNDTYFFRIHRWRGNGQEAWVGAAAQVWGKFSMIDVVGDGHADYPVDFTAIYLWPGFAPEFTRNNNMGGSIWDDSNSRVAEGDSVGRLAGGSFVGRVVIHADNSTTDPTYDPTQQPHTLGYMDQDEPLSADGSPNEDYYELGILTRENPTRFDGGDSRMWPHYADRIEPTGNFWEPTNDASTGKQGGHAPTVGFGPYDMGPGESIRIVMAEGINGLSLDARVAIGRTYKRSGGNDAMAIEYDANGDGVINPAPFDYSVVNTGAESQTKNQWVLSARDSLFKTFETALDVYGASSGMTTYPVAEAPHAPTFFSVTGKPNQIELRWTPASGGPAITGWEIWRTSKFEDNIYDYTLVAELPASANSYDDSSVIRGTDYYYYLQAIGDAQPNDPAGLAGTPSGTPLRSGRYLTQTYQPVNLKRPPGASISDAVVVPNPVILGSSVAVASFDKEDEIAFFDIPGECTIKVYTETGELITEIVHTDGSGDEKWNLTTEARQLLVSGIYIAVITDTANNAEIIRKFTVIR